MKPGQVDLKPIVDALKAKKAKQDAARAEWAKLDKKDGTLKGLAARVEAMEKLLASLLGEEGKA